MTRTNCVSGEFVHAIAIFLSLPHLQVAGLSHAGALVLGVFCTGVDMSPSVSALPSRSSSINSPLQAVASALNNHGIIPSPSEATSGFQRPLGHSFTDAALESPARTPASYDSTASVGGMPSTVGFSTPTVGNAASTAFVRESPHCASYTPGADSGGDAVSASPNGDRLNSSTGSHMSHTDIDVDGMASSPGRPETDGNSPDRQRSGGHRPRPPSASSAFSRTLKIVPSKVRMIEDPITNLLNQLYVGVGVGVHVCVYV